MGFCKICQGRISNIKLHFETKHGYGVGGRTEPYVGRDWCIKCKQQVPEAAKKEHEGCRRHNLEEGKEVCPTCGAAEGKEPLDRGCDCGAVPIDSLGSYARPIGRLSVELSKKDAMTVAPGYLLLFGRCQDHRVVELNNTDPASLLDAGTFSQCKVCASEGRRGKHADYLLLAPDGRLKSVITSAEWLLLPDGTQDRYEVSKGIAVLVK